MRIVGGKFKGRRLCAPSSNLIRPTSDKTRESLFNILEHQYGYIFDSGNMLDLFAGSGAVGFEALSRGMEFVLFVDKSIEARTLIRKNIELMDLFGCTKLFKRDATNLGQNIKFPPFNFIFADPPYNRSMADKAILVAANYGWLKHQALIVIEEQVGCEIKLDDRFLCLETRLFGETQLHIYEYGES